MTLLTNLEALAFAEFMRARQSGDLAAVTAAGVHWGKVRADEAFARLTHEQQVAAVQLTQGAGRLVQRTFMSEANAKGRQTAVTLTEAEFAEWVASGR